MAFVACGGSQRSQDKSCIHTTAVSKGVAMMTQDDNPVLPGTHELPMVEYQKGSKEGSTTPPEKTVRTRLSQGRGRPRLVTHEQQIESEEGALQHARNWVDAAVSYKDAISAATVDRSGLRRLQALYKHLPDEAKQSLDIKARLIVWLAPLHYFDRAQRWQQLLIRQMPTEDQLPDALWTTAYCHTVAIYYLRLSKLTRVDAILQGSIKRRLKGDFGACATMGHLVRLRKWARASQLFRDMRQYRDDGGDPGALHSLFQKFEMKHLKADVTDLIDYINQKGEVAVSEDLKQLRGRLIAQLVSSVQMADYKAKFQRSCSDILDLIRYLSKHGQGSATEYEPLILQLLMVQQPIDRPLHSRLVADAWALYSQTGQFRPSNKLMVRLLQAWMEGILMNPIPASANRQAFTPEVIQAAWLQCYDALGYLPRSILTKIYANNGDVDKVKLLVEDYVTTVIKGKRDPDFFWPYIKVHGVRKDAAAASAAFETLSSRFHVTPDAMSWDMLQYAYMRADNLEGAVHTFQRRLEAGVTVSAKSITTLMVLYSKIGNSDGVLSLLRLAEIHAIPIITHMKNALILAHAHAGEVDEAIEVFKNTVQEHKTGKVTGSLTQCFNSAMAMRARRREYLDAIEIYRQMKDEGVPLDTESYGAIITALCMRRNPSAAWRTLRKVMPEEKIEPTAFQYATIMTGFISTGEYRNALGVWEYMRKHSIEITIGTKAAYLRAKAMLEDRSTKDANTEESAENNPQLGNLEDTARELLEALSQDQKFSTQSEFGMRNIAPADAESTLFETLIYLHGRRRCFDTAWQLFQTYIDRRTRTQGKTYDKEDLSTAPPFRLTTAMMTVYFNAGQHELVQECWELLLRQATAIYQVPNANSLQLSLPTPSDADQSVSLVDSLQVSGLDTVKDTQTGDPSGSKEPVLAMASGRRFLLSLPFRYYASSVLAAPTASAETTTSLVRTLMSLLASGWQLDNVTWNVLIQRLCAMSPTRAVLAFSLTERFLIPQFPGWLYPRRVLTNVFGHPNASRVAGQVQYMDFPRRFLAPGDRLPFYKTMVWLAYALLELRRIEAVGMSSEIGSSRGLKAQVGTVREISTRAPKTCEQVHNLPVVLDAVQRKLIRKGDELTQGGRWFGQV
ncbi:hypothetical protein ANO11243_025930 [Dothideomycetidae sp. 11243]|nr:hypothetical protein ANO11243_025930 [fungal sp. No.11243]